MTKTANPKGDEIVEMLARIVDPEAFGLPAPLLPEGSDYLSDRDEAREKGRTAIAALSAAGYAIVPVEPTEAILKAGAKTFGPVLGGPGCETISSESYKAMIRAARAEIAEEHTDE